MIIARPTSKVVLPPGDPSDTDATMRVTSPYAMRGGSFHAALDIGNYHAGDTLIACADASVIGVGFLGAPWSGAKPSDAWWNAQPLNSGTGQRGGLYGPPSKWVGPTWGGLMTVLDLGQGWVASYAHQQDEQVSLGQRVARGQVIGHLGDSGSSYRQPHLHFGIRFEGASGNGQGGWVDPWPLINGAAHAHINEDADVKIPANLKHIAQAVVGVGNRIRVDPQTATGARILDSTIFVQVYGLGVKGQPYTLGGVASDLYAWVAAYGETGYVAEPLLKDYALTPTGQRVIPEQPADCSAQDQTIAQLSTKLARASTSAAGAAQAATATVEALR